MLTMSLESQLELILAEASCESITRSLVGRLSGLMDGIGASLKASASTLANANMLGFVRSKTMDDRSSELNYVSLKKNAIRIPSGLKVTYKSYFTAMNGAAEYIQHVDTDVLMVLQKRLLALYGQPELLLAGTSSDSSRMIKKQHDEMLRLRANLAGCINPKSTVDIAEFGSGFANMGEWKQVAELSGLLGAATSSIDYNAIAKQMDTTLEYSSRLRNEVISNNDELKASNHGIAELSTMMYNVADIIEFTGAFITFNNTLASAYNEMAADFGKKFL